VQKLLDFDLVIESNDDGFRTRVVASPAGEAQVGFDLPFTDKDLRILILEVVGSIGRLRRKVRRIESQERQLLENFGGQLFQAVFSGPVGECLERSRIAAQSKDAGLRIRLRLPGTLANIPWEYLYDAAHGFLGLDSETALVRYLELPAPVRPFPISPPLRILAMISAPTDIAGLQSEEEWAKLNDTLGDLVREGLVKVDRLEAGNLAALQRPMRLTEYHVLHFIGHGGYDENAQDGALALEDTDRKTRLVTGRDLGMMIRNHRSLRLVVLNACEGARSAQDDPFGGVAQALVHQGIPAVIAMQFEISDPAALTFSHSFYQAIADSLPVDVATVEARRAMFAGGNEIEWATPVLYLRSTDGRIFTRGRGSPAERQAREDADRQARVEAERQAREDADRQARVEAERQAQLPVPVASPIVLAIPLLILALHLGATTFHITDKSLSWLVFWSAVLGCTVAAVECRRRRIVGWIVALEFIFAWFLFYAIYQLNIGGIHRLRHYHVSELGTLAAIGAIVSASLCIRKLARFFRRKRAVHPLLPAFLGCIAVGFGAAAIGYAGGFYSNIVALHNSAGKAYVISIVFFSIALLIDLMLPFVELARRLQGRHASRPPSIPTKR
jgi:CHAT domain-containing protein